MRLWIAYSKVENIASKLMTCGADFDYASAVAIAEWVKACNSSYIPSELPERIAGFSADFVIASLVKSGAAFVAGYPTPYPAPDRATQSIVVQRQTGQGPLAEPIMTDQ